MTHLQALIKIASSGAGYNGARRALACARAV